LVRLMETMSAAEKACMCTAPNASKRSTKVLSE
jgi:hypothetical protein